MGSNNSKESEDYNRRNRTKPILKKPTVYPGTYIPQQTGYPQYTNNSSIPYDTNNIQTQGKNNLPDNSLSSHSHHSRHRHHRHRHHHRPQCSERATQTTPSVLYRVDERSQKPLSITNDGRSTPVLLRENSRSTPALLEESWSSNSLDKRSPVPIKKSPRTISTYKSTSSAAVKQLSPANVDKKH
ncbi:unnamed protein product [Rotaria sordida]|uniref:Uncharacterized protein n=1 Tax=Rotaria sordida TaxID=392033 RepID=A0A814I174_9BILA|nr:unnamed protein product [Rotaria sordida]